MSQRRTSDSVDVHTEQFDEREPSANVPDHRLRGETTPAAAIAMGPSGGPSGGPSLKRNIASDDCHSMICRAGRFTPHVSLEWDICTELHC